MSEQTMLGATAEPVEAAEIAAETPAVEATAETQTVDDTAAVEQSTQEPEAEEDKKPERNENHGAPEGDEDYEAFTAPEGEEYAEEMVSAVKGLAKDLDLSQAGAQKLMEKASAMTKSFNTSLEETVSASKREWATQVEKDPEVGGAQLKENLGYAAKAIAEYAPPELKELLDTSGLGNHPALVKTFIKVGKAMTGDNQRIVTGANQTSREALPIEKRIYPNNP